MNGFFYAILGFVLAIGLLTTVHEYGHFIVARLVGVKVLRFSIGFGRSLVTWHDKQGTEYAISAIPLGGYVKMLDQNEAPVAQNEVQHAFNNKPVWARMLVIAAGPFFNILFAVAAYWAMFMIGISSIVPMLGDVSPGSVAAISGMQRGQEIIAIDGQPTPSWEQISVALVSKVGDQDFVNVTTYDAERNSEEVHALNLSNWSLGNGDENILLNLGIQPIDPIEPVVDQVMPDYPAAQAGIESGDRIIAVDDQPVFSRTQLIGSLRDKANVATSLTIERDGDRFDVLITPVKRVIDGGATSGYIGIQFEPKAWPEDLIRTQRFGPVDSFLKALERTSDYTVLTLQFLKKMVVGHMSLQHVAGPISIAKFAGRTVASGIEYFLGFLALVSISLAVLNMLPIPILDGGHFLFCCIELISGKAVSQKAMQYGNMLGFVILGGFMILALHNDIVRIMH